MSRLIPILAVLFVAVAAAPASAQHIVYPAPGVYHQPIMHHQPMVYQQPIVHHQPMVYQQPVFNFVRPAGSNISDTPGMNAWQAGYLFNRPLFAGPASAHPISRPFWMPSSHDPDRVFGGSPFQNRPVLNIAIGLALR